jgi:hypothetical protein
MPLASTNISYTISGRHFGIGYIYILPPSPSDTFLYMQDQHTITGVTAAWFCDPGQNFNDFDEEKCFSTAGGQNVSRPPPPGYDACPWGPTDDPQV